MQQPRHTRPVQLSSDWYCYADYRIGVGEGLYSAVWVIRIVVGMVRGEYVYSDSVGGIKSVRLIAHRW